MCRSGRLCLLIQGLLALALLSTGWSLEIASSHFDTDLQGWMLAGSGTLIQTNSGGNPGGYARFTDVAGDAGDGWIWAPTNYCCSWSGIQDFGLLSWDHIVVEPGDSPTILSGEAKIYGPAGMATFQSSEAFSNGWKTFIAYLDQSKWAVSGDWYALLANITGLAIRIEAAYNGGPSLDVDGIDNVFLGVWEPVIVSESGGRLTWTNYTGNYWYTVQWASCLTGTWHGWCDVPMSGVATGTTTSVEIPRFFRVSTAGGPTPCDVVISPNSATITTNGQASVFTATGGSGSYTWRLDNYNRGTVNATTGSSVTYTRTASGDNSITVNDSNNPVDEDSAFISQP